MKKKTSICISCDWLISNSMSDRCQKMRVERSRQIECVGQSKHSRMNLPESNVEFINHEINSLSLGEVKFDV